MSIDYICELTASITNTLGEQFDISSACPVVFGKQISKYNSVGIDKVPFHEGICDRVCVLLQGWLVRGCKVQVSCQLLPPDSPVTCEASAKSIVFDIIKSLLNQLLINYGKN